MEDRKKERAQERAYEMAIKLKFHHRFDFIFLLCIYICIGCGIFTLYTQEVVLQNPTGRWSNQLLHAFLGTFILFLVYKFNYQHLSVYALPLYAFSIFLLLLTLIPGIGVEVNGARSWIRIGDIGFQTSEFAKLGTIILLAKYLDLKEREMHLFSSLVLPFIITIIPVALIVVQPDFGSAFSLLPVLLAILFIAGVDIYYILSIMTLCGLSIVIPLYIEYHNIILLPALVQHLEELNKIDLIPAVRILGADIWSFINEGILPKQTSGQDAEYLSRILQSENLVYSLEDASATVRYKAGGFLLVFLEKVRLLFIVGGILLFFAIGLLAFRMARGAVYTKLRKFYIPIGVIGSALIIAGTLHSVFPFQRHQVARITSFINPEKFPRDLAYQIRASKAAIGSGEFSGRGFWRGEMTIGRYPLVPEAYTDFVFTSWSERTGFLGSVFLLLTLIAIPLRGLLLSSDARDRFGSLLASGISFLFFFHITVNIGISLGLLPVTGLPLSFVSYGGSHLLICMVGAGILMNIYRNKLTQIN